MDLLKEHSPLIFAHFIDEYRLLGVAPGAGTPALVLWDFSTEWEPTTNSKLTLELEETISEDLELWVMCECESSKTPLPFREDPGAGIIAFFLDGTVTGVRTFVVPVKALTGLKHGRSLRLSQKHPTIKWDDWKHFVVPVDPPAGPPETIQPPFMFHSQMVYLEETDRDLFLHVYDFSGSLYSRTAKEKGRRTSDAPSPPPYLPHEFRLPIRSSRDLETYVMPEGCIFFDKVRILR